MLLPLRGACLDILEYQFLGLGRCPRTGACRWALSQAQLGLGQARQASRRRHSRRLSKLMVQARAGPLLPQARLLHPPLLRGGRVHVMILVFPKDLPEFLLVTVREMQKSKVRKRRAVTHRRGRLEDQAVPLPWQARAQPGLQR